MEETLMDLLALLGALESMTDRGQKRPIFGLVRYMNDKGLMRKFDMKRYVEHIEKTCGIILSKERQGELF